MVVSDTVEILVCPDCYDYITSGEVNNPAWQGMAQWTNDYRFDIFVDNMDPFKMKTPCHTCNETDGLRHAAKAIPNS